MNRWLLIMIIFIVTLTAAALSAQPLLEGPEGLAFTDAELHKVVEVLARLGNISIFLDEEVKNKRITFFARDLSVRESMELLVATNGLKMKKMQHGVYLIYPRKRDDEYDDDLVSHVFQFNNRDPKNMINILKGIGKKTKVFMNETIHAVVMIDTAENIEVARRLVKSMDFSRRQVMIDVKLVEVQKGSLRELGPQFSKTELTFGEFKSLPTAQTSIVLDAMINDNRATLLASPRIRVLDKEEAEINVGDRIPIEITTSSRTAGGDNIQLNRTVQWESVGIKLKIECQKIHDEDAITLKIYNEVSSVVSYTQAGYPHIRTRNASTSLRLTNGETVAFGGLINNREDNRSDHIPLLARIPVLGRVFQDIRRDKSQTEIVMFVTPKLMAPNVPELPMSVPSITAVDTCVKMSGECLPQVKVTEPETVSRATVPAPATQSRSAKELPVKRVNLLQETKITESRSSELPGGTKMAELLRRLKAEH